MSEYILVDTAINIGIFENIKGFELSDYPEIEENLDIFIGGDILRVKADAVADAFNDEKVKAVRMGWSKVPKNHPIKSAEDFWKILAMHISYEEHNQ